MRLSAKRAVRALVGLTLIAGLGYAAFAWWQPGPPFELSAWVADWQLEEGLEDLRTFAGELDSVQAFAVYFDEADRPHVTEGLQAGIAGIRDAMAARPLPLYLTFVNDIVRQDGTSSQKDAALIARLMASEESREALLGQVMELADELGADGVEMDLERIAEEDWSRVLLFYEALHRRLEAAGKRLRIVLEPRAPIEQFAWPEGPEYVMMAYNLFGTHSGPGPKADEAFIRRLAARMRQLPGDHVMAFATGGFDWARTGEVRAVTEREAAALAEHRISPLSRDGASGSVYFVYADAQGTRHEVWYADRETLKRWIGAAGEEGIRKAAIWRLGGLDESALTGLRP